MSLRRSDPLDVEMQMDLTSPTRPSREGLTYSNPVLRDLRFNSEKPFVREADSSAKWISSGLPTIRPERWIG
jgi:hypothetical protein